MGLGRCRASVGDAPPRGRTPETIALANGSISCTVTGTCVISAPEPVSMSLFGFGLLAELQMRTYHESQRRPIYRVRHRLRHGDQPLKAEGLDEDRPAVTGLTGEATVTDGRGTPR